MVPPLNWQKSSVSGRGAGTACVELASTPGTAYVREGDTPTTHLATTAVPLSHLLRSIKSGKLTAPGPSKDL